MKIRDRGAVRDAPPSLLHRPGTTAPPERPWLRAALTDLHLDPVIDAITKGRDEALRPLFMTPLQDVADVVYRHDVFRDLATADLRTHVEAFARRMQRLPGRRRFAGTQLDPRRAQRLALAGASAYVAAVAALAHELARTALVSDALRGAASYVAAYVRSPAFTALQGDVARLERDLAEVRYGLEIHEDRVHVSRSVGDEDYGAAVERTFRTFRRSSTADAPVAATGPDETNAVEAEILERVARLHPAVFADLEGFARRHSAYVDPGVAQLERELRFYLAYLTYMDRFEAAGLSFCLPDVAADDKRIDVRGAFDLALAGLLVADGEPVVVNDVRLEGAERVLVVTGANQGGKSTFARTVGQLHFLGALGCPVPARTARLFLFRELLTHFDRSEALSTLRGKLEEELTRLHALLERATPRSVVVMNEAFSSTSSDDAFALGKGTLARILELDAVGVFVTFVDRLASFDPRIASVTTTVRPDDPSHRTFELVRGPAAGSAHALALAGTYRLTYDELRRRLAP
ncbi:MAG: DNA mismatch repair protein MutS [Trueperaceae bacterium]